MWHHKGRRDPWGIWVRYELISADGSIVVLRDNGQLLLLKPADRSNRETMRLLGDYKTEFPFAVAAQFDNQIEKECPHWKVRVERASSWVRTIWLSLVLIVLLVGVSRLLQMLGIDVSPAIPSGEGY
jgi:hypothetical protein